jgi:Cyclin, N-terminal domain/Cyclin, C-terminal domain
MDTASYVPPGASSCDDVGDVVANMLKQESTTYKREDYLTALLPSKLNGETIDGSWRQRIVEWMYGVVDHCNLRRESVAVATYFLDLASCHDLVRSRKDFQLVAMTSLMLSIKLNDSTMVKLDSMVKLGRGLFNEEDVINMETKMLKAFKWHVHPPTPVCYMRQLLRLLPPETTPVTRYIIVEVTRFISEISACLYKFVKYPASSMAFAAIIIAMEKIDESTLPVWQRHQFLYNVASTTGLNSTSWEVLHAAEDLRISLDNNVNLQDLMRTIDAQCLRANQVQSPTETKDCEMQPASPTSPRDVSAGVY